MAWLQDQVPRVSAVSDLAKAMRYALRHWPGLIVFLEDGRIEMDTNVVERAIRPQTLTRKNALFAGSDGGARHWAIAMTLIQTADGVPAGHRNDADETALCRARHRAVYAARRTMPNGLVFPRAGYDLDMIGSA